MTVCVYIERIRKDAHTKNGRPRRWTYTRYIHWKQTSVVCSRGTFARALRQNANGTDDGIHMHAFRQPGRQAGMKDSARLCRPRNAQRTKTLSSMPNKLYDACALCVLLESVISAKGWPYIIRRASAREKRDWSVCLEAHYKAVSKLFKNEETTHERRSSRSTFRSAYIQHRHNHNSISKCFDDHFDCKYYCLWLHFVSEQPSQAIGLCNEIGSIENVAMKRTQA